MLLVTFEFNVGDSLVQALGRAYQDNKIGLLLAHGSNYGWKTFLPPVTHMGTSGSWTQGCWVQVRHPNHRAKADPLYSTLSLRFKGHFPGEPGLAGGDNWSYESWKAPVKSSPPTNQFSFYRTDALPVAQPTVSKHWREKYHIPWTCLPQAHLGVFQLCLWPLTAPGYLGGGLPCLSSALWCQYSTLLYSTVSSNYKQLHHKQILKPCTSAVVLSV